MIETLLLFFIVFIFNLESNQKTNEVDKNIAIVNGVVLSPEEARFPNAEVVFSDTKATFVTHTNINGEYEIKLPTGIYEITTKIDKWYDLRRAKIEVNAESLNSITLLPSPRINTISLVINKNGLQDEIKLLPEPKYFYFSPDKTNEEIRALMQYYGMTKNRVPVYLSATLTYDKTTISAKRIKVFNTICINAQDVFFEQENKVWRGKKLVGCFEKTRLKTSVKK